MLTSYQSAVVFMLFAGVSLIVGLWIFTAVKSHLLLREFKARMPQQALAAFPEAFNAGRSPKKVWFFFTVSAERLLGADSRLSAMRVQFVRMAVASLIAPFLFFLLIAAAALLLRR
jgi:hypothetical protein